MSDRKPTSVILPTVVALMVLLGLYVGAYYAIVKRELGIIAADNPWPDGLRWNAAYPDQRLDSFFAAIHRLDCRIRPHVWEP